MATDTTQSPDELDAFQRYINERHNGSLNGHTVDEAIAEFREYQRQLAECRAKIQAGLDSADTEGTQPLTEERLNTLIEKADQQLKKTLQVIRVFDGCREYAKLFEMP